MAEQKQKERTLIVVKPDGVQRSLVGEIVRRYERVGLKIVGMKFVYPSEEMATKHYYDVGGDEWLEEVGRKARAAYEKKGLQSPYETNRENGEAVLKSNAQYLSSGPVAAIVLEGSQAVELTRKIAGATEPLTADVGTIRADFTLDSYSLADTDARSVRNLLHASGSAEEAEQEIKIWFKDEELIDYTHLNEKILYEKDLFNQG